MIVPSIDIQNGRAVQLRRGREFVLDGGDPLERLAQFAVAGEVAVIDLDAALGRGSNAALIREMVRRAPCRVGGGIRTLEAAYDWLDVGAARIIVGTAAEADVLRPLPRERVIAAVDADRGTVVVDGWRRLTGAPVLERIRALAPFVGGFLLTQVEHEGAMGGFDEDLVREAVRAAGDARVTAAGGITTGADVAFLDALGADAQVGMALYTERLTLGDAVAAALVKPVDGGVWPTVVADEWDRVLGLAWSTRETVAEAVNTRRGVYWSRSRGATWIKGAMSGNTQELLRVRLDCDRDALTFVVRQAGSGFCHTGTRTCFGADFGLPELERVLAARISGPPSDSGTAKLASDPGLLRAKLREEAEELAAAGPDAVTHEAADVLYFTMVAAARAGVSLRDIVHELERRHRRVRRRPMEAKPADHEPAP